MYGIGWPLHQSEHSLSSPPPSLGSIKGRCDISKALVYKSMIPFNGCKSFLYKFSNENTSLFTSSFCERNILHFLLPLHFWKETSSISHFFFIFGKKILHLSVPLHFWKETESFRTFFSFCERNNLHFSLFLHFWKETSFISCFLFIFRKKHPSFLTSSSFLERNNHKMLIYSSNPGRKQSSLIYNKSHTNSGQNKFTFYSLSIDTSSVIPPQLYIGNLLRHLRLYHYQKVDLTTII